jgi:hypothetical protein
MRDLHAMDLPQPRIEECGVQASVRIERVVGSISAPVFLPDETAADVAVEELGMDVDDLPVVMWTAVAGRSLAVALAVGAAAGFALHDPRVGLAVAVGTWLLQEIRVVVDMVPFSFGEGFIGYRGDQGWPQGVQEDDDVRWSWRAPANAGQPQHHAAIPGK